GKPTITLTLKWIDLLSKEEGSSEETAHDAQQLIDSVGRATASARKAWLPFGPPPAATAAKISAASIAASTSRDPSALEAWAIAGESWNHGDVPGAESALKNALALDPSFDRAQVDLAWIRLSQ